MAKYSYLYHNAALKHLPLYSRVCGSALCRLFMHRTWHSLAGYQGHFPERARNTWLLPNLFALAYQLNYMCTDWFMRRGGALAFVQSAVWNSVCFSRWGFDLAIFPICHLFSRHLGQSLSPSCSSLFCAVLAVVNLKPITYITCCTVDLIKGILAPALWKWCLSAENREKPDTMIKFKH